MSAIQLKMFVEELTALPLGVGFFLAGAGVVFLLLGHRIFKGVMAVSFAAVGYTLGSALAPSGVLQIMVGLVSAVALGTISAFFVRAAVAILTGGWCAIIILHVAARLEFADLVSWSLVVFAFAACISLTFIIYDEIVAFVTSLEGAFLCVAALVIIVSRSPMLWAHIRDLLLVNPFFGPFLVLAGTVTGFYFQLSDIRHKHTGTHM